MRSIPALFIIRAIALLMVTACSASPSATEEETRTQRHHADHGQHSAGDHHHEEMMNEVGEEQPHTSPHAEGHHRGHRFDDAEKWAERWDTPERHAWQKPAHVIELMQIEPGMNAVDVGAGTGYFTGPLSEAVGSEGAVLAVDIEESMVEWIRERAQKEGWNNVRAKVVSPSDPGLDPDSVDRVLIVNVWHHVAEREAYAKKLHEALEPGGRVYVVDYTTESPSGPPAKIRLEPEQVVGELKAAGLDARLVEDEELPRQYVVVATRPEK